MKKCCICGMKINHSDKIFNPYPLVQVHTGDYICCKVCNEILVVPTKCKIVDSSRFKNYRRLLRISKQFGIKQDLFIHIIYEATFLFEDQVCDVYIENIPSIIIEFFSCFFRDITITSLKDVENALTSRLFYPEKMIIEFVKEKGIQEVIWR